jgi:2-oxoglutarate-Fe(II)-dependent oxygenase superfamily protein
MQSENISESPLIFTIHDFLPPKECEESIAASEKIGYGDAPITTASGFEMRKDIRDNMRVMFDDVPLALKLFERARPFLPPRINHWELLALNERLRFYRYDLGQTFRPHYDGSFSRSRREWSLLTFMIYLNDDFTGGETVFYTDVGAERAMVVPRQGLALVFEHRQLHEGAPIKSGRKYVLRTDVMYHFPTAKV